jgi:hypothetical protein
MQNWKKLQFCVAGSKHDKLQSIARFRGQEMRQVKSSQVNTLPKAKSQAKDVIF